MPFSWHSKKVRLPIIASYPIKMMDNPAFRQWLSMTLFPNQSVFSNISVLPKSSAVTYKYITSWVDMSSSFPIGTLFRRNFSLMLQRTMKTKGRASVNLFTTLGAKVWLTLWLFTHKFKSAFVYVLSFIRVPVLDSIFSFVNNGTIRAIFLSTTHSLKCFITSLANHLWNINMYSIYHLGFIINRYILGEETI